MWQLNLATDHSGFSCRSFSTLWQLNLVTNPSVVLMPILLLTQTVISRHDARLSSTTHCALRASRIIYNLTNLSRCYSFLLSIWTYAAPCRTAHFPSNSFQCSLMILQALSLTLGQNHQASWFPSDSPGSLSLSLSSQSHKTSYTIERKSHMQRNCNTTSVCCSSAVDTYFTLAYHFFWSGTPSPMPMIAKIASYNVEYRDISSIQCSVVPCKYLSSHFTGSMLQLHFQAHEIVLQHPDDIQVASVNSHIFQ